MNNLEEYFDGRSYARKNFSLYLFMADYDKLVALAEKHHVKPRQVILALIRKEHAEMAKEKDILKPKPKGKED